MRGRRLTIALATCALTACASAAWAGMDEAKKWVEKEFQPSVLTTEQQLKEMEWFVDAAKPFKGMEINVLSETIPTHEYELKVLTKAFEEITGIKVNHQVLGEGEVVQAVQTQMQTNRNLYDGYINDSDLIGTPLAPAGGHQPVRLDQGRRQGRHVADARPRRPRPTAAAAPGSTRRRTRPTGSARAARRGRSWRTRSPRARPSTTTSWSSAGRAERPGVSWGQTLRV